MSRAQRTSPHGRWRRVHRRPFRLDVDALVTGSAAAIGTDDVTSWLERLDRAVVDAPDEHGRARLVFARAWAALGTRPTSSVLDDADDAAAAFDALGDARNAGRAAAFAAGTAADLGDVDGALDRSVDALVAVESAGDDEVAADVLDEVATVLQRLGAHDRAIELHERAGAAARRAGSRWRVDRSARSQTECLLAAARLDALTGVAGDGAAVRLHRAEGAARELAAVGGSEAATSEGARLLADVLCEMDRGEEAWLMLLTAAVPDVATEPEAYAAHLVIEARCLRRLGQATRAVALLDEALSLDVLPAAEGDALLALDERSRARHDAGDLDGALADVRTVMARVWARQRNLAGRAVDRLGPRVEAELERRHVSRSAEVDPLTEAGNRLALERRLDRSGDRPTVAVVAVDLDGFGALNEVHGRDVGDEVLARVAGLLRLEVRDGDLVARTGGDQFVLVLDGTDLDVARAVAERIRRRVATHGWDALGADLAPSVSVGVAAGAGRDARRVAQRADLALYDVVRRGGERAAS